ncbi:MAG: aminopeptidase [Chloroflexi bacterium]|nr:aminopeptidase [Chloroflexota bacterium]
MNDLENLQRAYAELTVRFGINLQPKQCVIISAEVIARDFVALLCDACYEAGAKYVHVQWNEPKQIRSRMLHTADEDLEFLPEYEVQRFEQYTRETWARIAVTGEEIPGNLEDVDPTRISRTMAARTRALKTYVDAQMSNRMQWSVVAAPTPGWARKVFPDLSAEDGVQRLWSLILKMVRADVPDPVSAWHEHGMRLKKVSAYMALHAVRAIRYFDPTLAADGRASTDLTIGLNDVPLWVAASASTPTGVEFMPNMPTEEVFCSPHRLKADGWVRTSKPIFPLGREVRGAYFRFEAGECVEAFAEHGEATLRSFLDIPGTRRLGEVSMVDVRSPVNQTGLVFYDTLFDENACCHIAFGRAYAECAAGGSEMSAGEREAIGLNESDAHEDFMIGTPEMDVYGIRADGSVVPVMKAGMFVDEIFA